MTGAYGNSPDYSGFRIDAGHNGGMTAQIKSYPSLDDIRLSYGNGHHTIVNVDGAGTMRKILESAGRKPSDEFPVECNPTGLYLVELRDSNGDPGHVGAFDGYGGVAMMKTLPDGTAYLGKLAVPKPIQRLGIGGKLFSRIAADHPDLIWRTKRENPIRDYYERNCDGSLESGPWIVFWKGDGFDPEKAAEKVLKKKITLLGRSSSRWDGNLGVQPVLK